jgi:acyl-CoA synthetase (AMP-forming)/AMP-acid ligase II
MLTHATRANYRTLLDAAGLRDDAPDAAAIVYIETGQPDITITRAMFRAQVVRYAAALHAKGIAPRDLVVIAHTQSLESIYAFWGALLLGAIPSMFPTLTEKLDPTLYLHNLAELVQLSDVRAVLTTDAFAPTMRACVGCPVFASGDLCAQGEPSQAAIDPHEIAFLQHSSGTTGLQKGVALSHDAVLNQLAHYADAIALRADDVIVSWLPLYHDMGLIAGFLLPLIQGVPLVLMSPFDWVARPALLLRAIHEYGGTLCWLPNFAYNHLARRVRPRDVEGVSLATMRMFINCSEPVYNDSHQLFVERFAPHGVRREMLAVSYAMAENVFAVTQTQTATAARLDYVERAALETRIALPAYPDAEGTVVKVSCGAPINGTEVRAMVQHDEAWVTLPERCVGELFVRSNCMLTGYYRRDDLDPFHDGWYHTGDMGYLADGEVYVTGRVKDLIINGGKNLYPQDIEAVVNSVAGVHPGRAVAFGVPDAREGTELIAVIAEADSDDAAEQQRIAAAIRQTVARALGVTVSFVEVVDGRWLIKTSSGKISRAANRARWLARAKGELLYKQKDHCAPDLS